MASIRTDAFPKLIAWDGKTESLPDHIRNLGAIPPAWREIYFSADPDADLYLVARDTKGRRQYIYSPAHVSAAQERKFHRVRAYLHHVPKIRTYLKSIDDPDTRDCLLLIFETGLRPGSQRETKANKKARGATTLRGENVVERDGSIYLEFTGKDGVFQSHRLQHTALRDNVVGRAEQAGDNGLLYGHTSESHLRKALEPLGLHPKDLRTLLACTAASRMLARRKPADTVSDFTKARSEIGDAVAAILGNTRSVALESYIDPEIFEKWAPQSAAAWNEKMQRKPSRRAVSAIAAFDHTDASILVKRANRALAQHRAAPSVLSEQEASDYDAGYGYGTAHLPSRDPESP